MHPTAQVSAGIGASQDGPWREVNRERSRRVSAPEGGGDPDTTLAQGELRAEVDPQLTSSRMPRCDAANAWGASEIWYSGLV